LAVEYKGRWSIIEIKLVRSYDVSGEVKAEGVTQVAQYRDKIDGKAPMYRMIFDRRPETKLLPWEKRLSWTHEGEITVVGC
jgi:hypothetical protein